ncbi:MAG: hypothetical protein AB7P67_11905 [Vicinamibacterales bacterium]
MRGPALGAALALGLLLAGVRAQEPVPEATMESLRGQIFQARTAISLLRTGDFQLREELIRELDAVQREADGLRSDRTRDAAPASTAIRVLADRVETVRRRARSGESVTGQGLGPTAVAGAGVPDLQPLDVPPDTPAVVRLLHAVDFDDAGASDVVEAATAEPVTAGGRAIAPAGALLRGAVVRDRGPATLVFSRIQIGYTTWVVTGVPAETSAPRLRAGAVVRLRLHPPAAPDSVR